ncbi:MAG: polysaccharide deacetylase family protein [Ferruginibacter sp.]
MDPDSEAEQAASKILKTSFITVVFATCHSYHTETTIFPVFTHTDINPPDTTAKNVVVKTAPPKKKKKTIYLTFDDGPNKGTKKVLDIVQQEQVAVSMFIIGEQVYGSKWQSAVYDSIKQSNYVELQNHSYTHAHSQYEKFYALPDSVVKDFSRCKDSLGLYSMIVRTPGRNIWRTANISSTDMKKSIAAADTLQQYGFTAVGWDLEWHYNNDLQLMNNEDEILQQVDSLFTHAKTKTPEHLVLLAHDQVYADANDSTALHCFIQKLKLKEEYDFEVISKYPGLKSVQ